MKRQFLLLSCFVLSATLAQSQSQSTGRRASPSVGPSAVSSQVTAARQANADVVRAARAAAVINNPLGGSRVAGTFPGGNTGSIPFGGTANQVQFGGNTGPVVNDPRGANFPGQVPFGAENQIPFGRTPETILPRDNTVIVATTGTINEPSGSAVVVGDVGGVARTAPVNNGRAQSPATVDQAFARELNAALARGGATRILFPKTSTSITFVNQNGSIVLLGVVPDEAEKRAVEARVKNSPDVTSVENRLRVVPNPSRVINAVQFNDALAQAGATQVLFPETSNPVTVVNQNGSILLQGLVADERERRKIEQSVRNSPDVVAVNSQLQVVQTATENVQLLPTP